ncbi:tRNA (adenosine(37)-N6)-dimethylallyltransferase MiaA [Fusobacterium sp. MFO224]|uniref:tRNA (adenosine(37)-N6)-dimethylallyltransferase MiaA n=1 Tax=Fusobacterium sp. MFO224 TaxID=3378070 RepID=UPI0038525FB6
MKGIVIAGPTGVGKTELSLKIAKLLQGDIISADSAQVYKGMDIGTAKITEKEKQGIKHYMIDIVEPIEKYSVGDYQKEVDTILKEKEKENKNVVLTGGTGLYIKSITEGLADLPKADKKLREEMKKYSDLEILEKLELLDKEAANNIHENNRKRVERALEVCILTGKKFSEISKKNVKNNNYKFLKLYLTRDRKKLYDRINKRVDIMMEQGLLEEVKSLYDKYGGETLKKINIIGYNELIDFLENKITLEEAVEAIKKNSRRYAKRQITWFKKDEEYISLDVEKMSEDEIISKIQKLYSSKLGE